MPRLRILVISAVLFSRAVPAVDDIQLSIGAIEHPNFKARQVNLALKLDHDNVARIQATASDVRASGIGFPIITLRCDDIGLDYEKFSCTRGKLQGRHPDLGEFHGSVSVHHEFDTNHLSLSITQLDLIGGQTAVGLAVDSRGVQGQVSGKSLDAKKMFALLRELDERFKPYEQVSGDLDIEADLEIAGRDLQRLNLGIDTHGLSFNGPNVAEDMDLTFRLRSARRAHDWSIAGFGRLLAGAFYVEPGLTVGDTIPGFTIEVSDKPVTVYWDIDRTIGNGIAGSAKIKHPGVLLLEVWRTLDKQGQAQTRITAQAQDLDQTYETYLQPLLLETAFDTVNLDGALTARAILREDKLADLTLSADDISLQDQSGRFGLDGLTGEFRINSGGQSERSRITWEKATLYRLELDRTNIVLESRLGQLRLAEAVHMPMLAGELRIDRLQTRGIGTPEFSLHMDTELAPISLEGLCKALDWPLMTGQVAGRIADLAYEHGDLKVNGALDVQVFDGKVTVRNLGVQELFGLVPRLNADIELDDLDLDTLTRTFAFGKMEGRLDGEIEKLRLEDWQPTYFESRFATPDDDDTRRRISQKAIDNLTSIGGGVTTTAASRLLLGLFKDFSYAELGWAWSLSRGVCKMDGVAPSGDGGYYIVRQGLLPPWLNIKGYNREVDWEVLINRLESIGASEGPVVK